MNIVTMVSAGYLSRAEQYLESLRVVKSAKVWIVCIDFQPPDELKRQYPYCEFVYSLDTERRFTNKMPTDGYAEWVPAVGLTDTDVVLRSDADVIVQRDFTPGELRIIQNENDLCIGPNCGDNDTLAAEGERIGLSANGLTYIPCYNGGCILATVGMFKRITNTLNENWTAFASSNASRSRSQFHLCMCLFTMPDKNLIPMPRTLHAHGHFGMPPGCELRGGKVYERERLVMFRHHL